MGQMLRWQLLRGLGVLAMAAGIAAAVYYVTPLIFPFIFGWLIAYSLNPLVNILVRRARFPRWLAVTLSLLLFLGVAGGLITIAVTNIVIEINGLSLIIQNNLNDWKIAFTNYVNSEPIQLIINRFVNYYNENPQYQNTINSNLTTTGKTVTDFVSYMVKFILDSIVSLITKLPNMATVTLVALVAAFLISNDWALWKQRLVSWTPDFISRPTVMVWADLQKALFGYLRAQMILISITAIVVMIGLGLLGVDYAITIGLLIGLVDLMPYLGTGAAMVPWLIYEFVIGNYYLGIGLSILYGIILVARQILEPKVLATSIGLEALPTLIAMYVGLKLYGFVGLILGPVTLIIIASFHRAGVFKELWYYIVKGRSTTE